MVSSPAKVLRLKVLQSRSPLQGRSVRSLPSRLWHTDLPPNRASEAKWRQVQDSSLPPLEGTSTLQGCWEQPAASEGRPQAPPPRRRERQVDLSQKCLSLSLSLYQVGSTGRSNPAPRTRAHAPASHFFLSLSLSLSLLPSGLRGVRVPSGP